MSKKKSESSWKTISLPKAMLSTIEKFVESPEGKALGFASTAGFVTAAVRASPEFRRMVERMQAEKEA